jgi:hypothetical protein
MLAWRPRQSSPALAPFPALAFAVVCIAALATPITADAAPKGQRVHTDTAAANRLSDIDSAEKYYANLDYQNANAIAARAIAGNGLTHDQLIRAYKLLGLTFATLGKEDDAREAFTTLLMMSPDFELDPNLSPKVTGPFLEARGYWRGQSQKPGVEVVATVHSNDSARLVVTIRDPNHIVSNVNLGYRWGADGTFATRPLAIGDGVTVNVPASPNPSESRLDYYVQGMDARDNIVYEIGNALAPKSAVVDAPVVAAAPLVAGERSAGGGSKSILASPYFWAAAAAVVVGGVVGGYFAFRPKEPGGATLTSAADCGGMPCR